MDRVLAERSILEAIKCALDDNMIQSEIRGPYNDEDNKHHPYLIIGSGVGKISAWFDDDVEKIFIYSRSTKLHEIRLADPDSIIKLARALVFLAEKFSL